MRYVLAMLCALAAYPAEATVQKGTIFQLVNAGICTRKDVMAEIIGQPTRAEATVKMRNYYRTTLNGQTVCKRIASQRFLVLEVYDTAVMDGITFQFIEIVTPQGEKWYTAITDVAKEEAV